MGRDRHDGPCMDRLRHADKGEAPAAGAADAPRRAEQILDAARAGGNGGPLLFPSARSKRINDMTLSGLLGTLKIPAVPHGFRSTFGDLAAKETNNPPEVAMVRCRSVGEPWEIG